MPPCLRVDTPTARLFTSIPSYLHTSVATPTSSLQSSMPLYLPVASFSSTAPELRSPGPHRASGALTCSAPLELLPAAHLQHCIPPYLYVATPAARLQTSRPQCLHVCT